MPFLEASDGARLHLRDQGTGPPVVFLHGWMMSSRFWQGQLDALAPSRRCVAPDLRGCGASETRPGTHRMDRLADDVHDLLTSLDLQGVTLVGWSMGGGIAMRYLDRHGPDRLAAVGLIDFPPRFEEDPGVAEKVCERLRTDRRSFFSKFLKRMFLRPLDPSIESWVVRESERCATETACEMYRELGAGEARGRTYQLPAFLAFPQEGWYARSLDAWKTIFPQHVAPSFTSSRHAPFLEEPDVFNEALLRFLETAPEPAGARVV